MKDDFTIVLKCYLQSIRTKPVLGVNSLPHQSLDFLFVDEAGQVALANLIAMGTSARNIVLIGDQMQLGQPIQGVHPGRSGESTLEYLLDGLATIPPERGFS